MRMLTLTYPQKMRRVVVFLVVLIGNTSAPALFVGLKPGTVGVYQVNFGFHQPSPVICQ